MNRHWRYSRSQLRRQRETQQQRRRTIHQQRSQKHHRWKATNNNNSKNYNNTINTDINNNKYNNNNNELTELKKQPTTGDQRSPSSARHSVAPAHRADAASQLRYSYSYSYRKPKNHHKNYSTTHRNLFKNITLCFYFYNSSSLCLSKLCAQYVLVVVEKVEKVSTHVTLSAWTLTLLSS
ncbi:LOW QUALITY PROTEIN: probable serine/threonine-protein kinase DDB_G0291918 [Drosophila serrata]|uniref:LOW QUALITY PROTEIN: probable serine/threonine-protein kinase DDB_G0291918 n=1 Tax=Drosophila serrata TaxID=7274 RepID=UPI000A1D0874|nr:LOW QUALITY PROTEIN: probable serine/threonine-protein kinase DDB_G0291918 [Drosophila serrata]